MGANPGGEGVYILVVLTVEWKGQKYTVNVLNFSDR
jgi:hypothetical protein